MKHSKSHNKSISKIVALAAASLCLLSGLSGAQPSRAQGLPGEGGIRFNAPINAARDVSWDQKLDQQVALDTSFRNENGKVVPLSTYFGRKPVLLVMPFYKCPGICTTELNGMVDTFKDANLRFKVGRDFDVITVSINPKEGPELATAKKREYMDILAQPGAENGWHFLTGDEASIRKLADNVGFRYRYDAKTDQYAHPSGIVVLTPTGKISRYFFAVSYPAKDVRLSVIEAGHGRIGTAADKFVLACYHYDPQTGTYGLAIFRLMQVLGFATVFIMGTCMFVAFRKDYRDARVGQRGILAAARQDEAGDDRPDA